MRLRTTPRRPRAATLLAASTLIGASACATGFQLEPTVEKIEVFTEDFRAGEVFDLRGRNGRVSITSWDRAEAEITAHKVGAGDSSLDDITVEVRRSSDGVRVRTRHPKRRGVWGRSPGRVNYAVRLPRRADLRVFTGNGTVEISGITGEVAAQTVNGALLLTEHRGSVNAQTVNGRIECELEEFVAGQEHSFRTTNGRVHLVLGGKANGRVDARAVNGRVVLEIPDSQHLDPPTRRRKTVQIGEAGGGDCRVRTVNGAIHIVNDGS